MWTLLFLFLIYRYQRAAIGVAGMAYSACSDA